METWCMGKLILTHLEENFTIQLFELDLKDRQGCIGWKVNENSSSGRSS